MSNNIKNVLIIGKSITKNIKYLKKFIQINTKNSLMENKN